MKWLADRLITVAILLWLWQEFTARHRAWRRECRKAASPTEPTGEPDGPPSRSASMLKLERTIHSVLILGAAIALAMILMIATAQAQQPHGFEVRFVEPVERIDGEAFDPATEVSAYRVECKRTADWADAAFIVFERGDSVPDGNGRFFAWENAVPQGGWYDCRMNVADTLGLVSDWSNVVTVRRVARPTPPVMR